MYRWVDHTSELELEIEAASERDVLSDALRALAELLDDQTGSSEAPERRIVTATARDRPALLASWLEELLFLAESRGFIAHAVEQLELEPERVVGTVRGRVGEPRPLVKAVTYHRLEFERAGPGYRGRVVLDV